MLNPARLDSASKVKQSPSPMVADPDLMLAAETTG